MLSSLYRVGMNFQTRYSIGLPLLIREGLPVIRFIIPHKFSCLQPEIGAEKFLENRAKVIVCGSREEIAAKAAAQLKERFPDSHIGGLAPDLSNLL